MRTFITYVAVPIKAALFASSAIAGGVAESIAVEPVEVPQGMPAVQDWTGFYAGVQLGFLNGKDRGDVGDNADFDGSVYGVFGGYRHDFGTLVAGVEFDYVQGSGDWEVEGGDTFDVDFNSIVRFGAELGYDAGAALFYGTVGFAALEVGFRRNDFSDNGHFFGLGMDFRVSDRVTLGGEILHHDFSDFELPGNDLSATTVAANVAFTF